MGLFLQRRDDYCVRSEKQKRFIRLSKTSKRKINASAVPAVNGSCQRKSIENQRLVSQFVFLNNNMRHQAPKAKDPRKVHRNCNMYDTYDAYTSPNLRVSNRRNKYSHEQFQAIRTISMLDTFTNLCVGDQHMNTHTGLQDQRKYKYVICPQARYPTDTFESRASQIQRKRVKQRIFRPVSEDEEFAHNHRRHR